VALPAQWTFPVARHLSRTNYVIVRRFAALRSRRVFDVVGGSERNAFSAQVRLPQVVVSRQAMLIGVGKVVGGELVQVGGTIAQHGHGEILEEVRQAGWNVEIHRATTATGIHTAFTTAVDWFTVVSNR